ncbi:helix-turn-helix transcriptional regulator [Deinococcus roseus]|uniref:DNA-binding transcriptional regulator n=1 Tax=Deinococcus roseus TaxID=392414 RepID=A0ABQ2CYV6_9DEIO|nr:WYL domain-containing protein [Deinococcus roseus]GGJ27345.1 DNA-binding transcriptional regulator [Deinococcus roseus]
MFDSDNPHHKKARKLFEIIEMLRDRPCTSRELSQRLGISQRSVQRCLRDLQDLQIGLRQNKNIAGVFIYSLPSQAEQLNEVETLITHNAVRMLYHHATSPNHHYLRVLEKLAAKLGEPARSIVQRSTRNLKQRVSPVPDEGRTLETVARAWLHGKVVQFDYQSPGHTEGRQKYELEVYFVEVSRSNLATYVIGFERKYHQQIRTFKLSRMKNAVVQATTYQIPDSFDPSLYLSGAWGVIGASSGTPVSVRLKFDREATVRLQEGGYPNLTITHEFADGSSIASIQVGTDLQGFPREILPWVLSWGSKVQVLEPQSLRDRCQQEALAMLAHFASGAACPHVQPS